MAVNLYTSRSLLAALKLLAPAPSFLVDSFFGNSTTFATTEVDIDVYKEGRDLAPFVRSTGQGKLIENEGYDTRKYKPPYIKPKKKLEASEVLDRQAGESIHVQAGGDRLRANANEKRDQNLMELRNSILRRKEWMASKAMETGQVQVVGDGINDTIDYLRTGAHTIAVGSITAWNAAGSDKIKNLMDWQNLILKNGRRLATKLVLGTDAYIEFIKDSEIQAALDNRRIDIGEINVEDLQGGFARVGTLKAPMMEIWVYSDWYNHPDTGTLTNFMPEKKIFLGAPSMVTRNQQLYGAIEDMDAIEAGLSQTDIYPKIFRDFETGIEYMMLQSAPLIGLHEPDATLCAEVLP